MHSNPGVISVSGLSWPSLASAHQARCVRGCDGRVRGIPEKELGGYSGQSEWRIQKARWIALA